jgi:hypothetical protein
VFAIMIVSGREHNIWQMRRGVTRIGKIHDYLRVCPCKGERRVWLRKFGRSHVNARGEQNKGSRRASTPLGAKSDRPRQLNMGLLWQQVRHSAKQQ